MSERRPGSSDLAAAELPDEALAEHLARRAARPAPRALAASIITRVDETIPDRRWRLAVAAWRPRIAMAGSGLALVLVVALLAINAMPAPVGTDRGSPSAGTSPVPSAPFWDPTVRALTPPEFLRIMATDPVAGTVLIVDDQIVEVMVSCVSSQDCPEGQLVNASNPVTAPPGGHLPFDAGTTIPGPLALEVGSGPDLVFLGGVVSNATRLEFKAQDLAQRSAMGGLFVIPAWIHRGPVVPCPSVVAPHAPLPTSELGLPAPELATCSRGVYLTDADPGMPPYGISGGDPNAFAVQQDAYQQFASDPTADGTASRGVFLVRDWAGYGEVLAGLQPIGIPGIDVQATAGPTTEPTTPTSPASDVLSVNEFVGRVLDGSLPASSIVVADIPATAVTVLSPTAAGGPENPKHSRWAITSSAGSIRVDGIAKDGITGIAGVQGFLVEQSQAVRALGPVATDGVVPAGLFILHGWLRPGPGVPCPGPVTGHSPPVIGISSQPLIWSQCTGMWIVPTSTDPWAGPPNRILNPDGSGSITVGDHSVLPAGTLHVQDDAGDMLDSGSKEGDWLVRLALRNDCPPWAYCALVLADRPAPGVSWYELVGPIAAPAPDKVEQRPPSTQAP